MQQKIQSEQKNSLHNYTLGEELVNSISHGFGALFAIAGTVILLYYSIILSDSWKIASSVIYGFSMIVLYTISTVYHSLAKNRGKKVLRVLDHCIIYILITGTYTPFCLVTLYGWIGFSMFGVLLTATARRLAY
ncbi:MAG: hemolysin III family protein [Firmicutes bacterium]|nr:hemolysin III family protein [Bacillota bacterium]